MVMLYHGNFDSKCTRPLAEEQECQSSCEKLELGKRTCASGFHRNQLFPGVEEATFNIISRLVELVARPALGLLHEYMYGIIQDSLAENALYTTAVKESSGRCLSQADCVLFIAHSILARRGDQSFDGDQQAAPKSSDVGPQSDSQAYKLKALNMNIKLSIRKRSRWQLWHLRGRS
ncbi:hypothetical protein DSL72_000941 [Monilinia vaccinii-corymbosi]|uniref:Uncharacterized protein n=1 Tax=Monilinia vaccinii-corymbosi TaxID=61207 RepID=A0A8A3P6P3_9HELO|nr:hypothetical protein DSL72_000941 [Monilinia vaccinii-corymbosi]